MYLCMYSSLQKDSGIQEKCGDGVKEGKGKEKGRKMEGKGIIFLYFSEILDHRFRP